MARTVQVHLLDDLDGSPADETVQFSLDGHSYEIDLSTGHAEALRKITAKYIVAGRRARGGVVTGGRGRRTARPSSVVGREQNQAIREWAQKAGLDVSTRGRIPASIVEQYDKQADH
jgi:hypothetical protein